MGGLLGGQRVCWPPPPLSNYWGGGLVHLLTVKHSDLKKKKRLKIRTVESFIVLECVLSIVWSKKML